MRKIIIAILILLVTFNTGCSENKYSEINDEEGLVEKVETFEENLAQLYIRDIDLETFKENVKGIYSDGLQKDFFSDFEFSFDKERLAKKEKYYKDNNYKHGRIEKELFYYYYKDAIDIHVSVANKITPGTFEGEKRVYVKRLDTIYNEDDFIIAEFLKFKRYNFKNIDGKWRITETRIVEENLFGLDDAERQELISKLPFNLYKEEGVEYIDMFSIENNQ